MCEKRFGILAQLPSAPHTFHLLNAMHSGAKEGIFSLPAQAVGYMAREWPGVAFVIIELDEESAPLRLIKPPQCLKHLTQREESHGESGERSIADRTESPTGSGNDAYAENTVSTWGIDPAARHEDHCAIWKAGLLHITFIPAEDNGRLEELPPAAEGELLQRTEEGEA